jgi:cysteinyl-tRNA synthetase, unknown class
MPRFKTLRGPIDVFQWGYQLQGKNGAPLSERKLTAAEHDMLVIDFARDGTNDSAFSKSEVAAISAGSDNSRLLVSYISIGEASDYRDDWDKSWTTTGKAAADLTAQAPGWLGPTNPDWPESRKVRYWDEGWQKLIFNDAKTGWLDSIVGNGFDAAYLDIVDAYYFWAAEAKPSERMAGDPVTATDAAQRMADFIVKMTTHARKTNPDFFVIQQNGDFIVSDMGDADPSLKQAFYDSIGGIAVEDLYFYGSKDEDNTYRPDQNRIRVLKEDYLAKGKAVFVVDYLKDPKKIDTFLKKAIADGFLPTVASDRDLDRLSPAATTDTSSNKRDVWLGTAEADIFKAGKGSDILNGMGDDDRLSGGAGKDYLSGSDGADILSGGSDRDWLAGGTGDDLLKGGRGGDLFVFRPNDGTDRIRDFDTDADRIDLKAFSVSFSTLLLNAVDENGATRIKLGDDSLILDGVRKSDLSSNDFLL